MIGVYPVKVRAVPVAEIILLVKDCPTLTRFVPTLQREIIFRRTKTSSGGRFCKNFVPGVSHLVLELHIFMCSRPETTLGTVFAMPHASPFGVVSRIVFREGTSFVVGRSRTATTNKIRRLDTDLRLHKSENCIYELCKTRAG